MTAINQWVHRIANGRSGRHIAKQAGIHPATLNRQLADETMTPETVVKIAHAFDASAVEGLVALGLLAETDVGAARISDALAGATDEQLADEVLRRMRLGSDSFDQPLDNVRPLAGRSQGPEPGSAPIGMVADYQAEPIEADHDDSMYDI